jgi:hypothetical protein
VKLHVLTMQTLVLSDDISDAELEQIEYDIAHGIQLDRPLESEALAHRIEGGPVTWLKGKTEIMAWFSARTGGR